MSAAPGRDLPAPSSASFANMPEDNPFMAGAYLGFGQGEAVINVGISGPGVVKRAIERLRSLNIPTWICRCWPAKSNKPPSG